MRVDIVNFWWIDGHFLNLFSLKLSLEYLIINLQVVLDLFDEGLKGLEIKLALVKELLAFDWY